MLRTVVQNSLSAYRTICENNLTAAFSTNGAVSAAANKYLCEWFSGQSSAQNRDQIRYKIEQQMPKTSNSFVDFNFPLFKLRGVAVFHFNPKLRQSPSERKVGGYSADTGRTYPQWTNRSWFWPTLSLPAQTLFFRYRNFPVPWWLRQLHCNNVEKQIVRMRLSDRARKLLRWE